MAGEGRGQFTFYRSYFEALASLPKKDKLPVYEAICAYALDGKFPSLTGVQLSVFTLIKPTLDASRKKAASGKKGGTSKQTGSKLEANQKQSASEKEKEKEGEKEKEYECTPPCPSSCGGGPAFELETDFNWFWKTYPNAIGGKEAAHEAWVLVARDIETSRQIQAALEIFMQSAVWKKEDGRYIPSASNFLAKGYWRKPPTLSGSSDIPKGASGQLGDAEMEAIQRVLREEI